MSYFTRLYLDIYSLPSILHLHLSFTQRQRFYNCSRCKISSRSRDIQYLTLRISFLGFNYFLRSKVKFFSAFSSIWHELLLLTLDRFAGSLFFSGYFSSRSQYGNFQAFVSFNTEKVVGGFSCGCSKFVFVDYVFWVLTTFRFELLQAFNLSF